MTLLAVLAAACGSEASDVGAGDVEVDPLTSVSADLTTIPASTSISTSSSIPSTSVPLSATDEASTTTTEASTTTSDAATTTTAAPTTTLVSAGSETTSVPFDGGLDGPVDAAEQTVRLRFESKIDDVSSEQLAAEALAVLNDDRGWPRAGFRFVADEASPFRVVLAEGLEVNELCLPLRTYGTVSCQNGPVVALNADRWRGAVPHWDAEVADYRGYLINHEVGHLLGQRHPRPRCPVAGRPAGVMEQQTAGLEGCTGNAWPRDWEIDLARLRPVVYAPLPDWGPEPVPANGES